MTIAPAEMTLDELREALAPLIPAHAAFDGWTPAALGMAAVQLGVPADRARLAYPGGTIEMIDAWFASIDRAMAIALPPEAIAALKIRERITALVETRINLIAPYREALRRALAILAFPTNAGTAARLGWRAADAMWRLADDRASDFSHYSKRLTLAGVYASTRLVLLDDESEGQADTRAFLARRIDDVMRFERLKARLRPDPERRFSPARLLGRLRYPAV